MSLKIWTAAVIVLASVSALVWFSAPQSRKEVASVALPGPEQKAVVPSSTDDGPEMISIGTVKKNSVKRVAILLTTNGISNTWIGPEGVHVLVTVGDQERAAKLVSEDAKKSGYFFAGVFLNRKHHKG